METIIVDGFAAVATLAQEAHDFLAGILAATAMVAGVLLWRVFIVACRSHDVL